MNSRCTQPTALETFHTVEKDTAREGATKVRGPGRGLFCSGLKVVINKRISFPGSKIIVVMAFRLDCLHSHQVIYRWKFEVESMQLLKGIRNTWWADETNWGPSFPLLGMVRGKMYPERHRRWTMIQWISGVVEGGGGSLCTTFQLHNIRCVHSKSDWHFDGQSKTNFLKGLLHPLSKSDSPSNGISLKKKCNEMWLVQMSVKFIVLLKSYWVFVYEMYFSVFEA